MKTLEKFSKSKIKIKITLDSIKLQKIILKKKYENIEIKIVHENTLHEKILFIREFLVFFFICVGFKSIYKQKNFQKPKKFH